MTNLADQFESRFDKIRQVNSDGAEYWSGRDLYKLLGYAEWSRIRATYEDVYTSLCLENPAQLEMVKAEKVIASGKGASRTFPDWHLSRVALNRVLSRVASRKPIAALELRHQQGNQFRIETHIGAWLMEFCTHAELTLTYQKTLDRYRFDFCVGDRILIEVDEEHHQHSHQSAIDLEKNRVAQLHGFKLLRIKTADNWNIAMLFGTLTRMINEGLLPISIIKEIVQSQLKIEMQRLKIMTIQEQAMFDDCGYQAPYNGLIEREIIERKG